MEPTHLRPAVRKYHILWFYDLTNPIYGRSLHLIVVFLGRKRFQLQSVFIPAVHSSDHHHISNCEEFHAMADFIARVELHAANYDDYEQLHQSMQQRGFSRVIVGSDGNTYQLPTGTYVARNVNVTVDVALNAAIAAANDTGKASATIVTNWDMARWNGLAILR